jgi:hypothetical protein
MVSLSPSGRTATERMIAAANYLGGHWASLTLAEKEDLPRLEGIKIRWPRRKCFLS